VLLHTIIKLLFIGVEIMTVLLTKRNIHIKNVFSETLKLDYVVPLKIPESTGPLYS